MGPVINSIMKSKRDVNKDINKFVDFTDFIEKVFYKSAATDITNTKSNITYFFEEDFRGKFSNVKFQNLERQLMQKENFLNHNKKIEEFQKDMYVN